MAKPSKAPTTHIATQVNQVWSWDISYLPSHVRGLYHYLQPKDSRPRVSNDNAYSESLFRTLKYCPQWPSQGFSTLESARGWVAVFVSWYNNEHRHSRIKFVTPAQRHRGEDKAILQKRVNVYELAKARNPWCWSGNARNWNLVGAVTLNPERTEIKEAA